MQKCLFMRNSAHLKDLNILRFRIASHRQFFQQISNKCAWILWNTSKIFQAGTSRYQGWFSTSNWMTEIDYGSSSVQVWRFVRDSRITPRKRLKVTCSRTKIISQWCRIIWIVWDLSHQCYACRKHNIRSNTLRVHST